MVHLGPRLRVFARNMDPKLATVFDARLFKKRTNGRFAHVFWHIIICTKLQLNVFVWLCALPEPVFWIFALLV